MIEILERQGGALVARAFGGGDRFDPADKWDVDESRAPREGRVRALLDLDLRAAKPRQLLDDVRLLAKDRKLCGRVAIVANPILGALARFALAGASGEVRMFSRADRERARKWILEGVPGGTSAERESPLDMVDEASDESFPASDPPGYTRHHM